MARTRRKINPKTRDFLPYGSLLYVESKNSRDNINPDWFALPDTVNQETAASWTYVIVVLLRNKSVVIGCPNPAVARMNFGEKGLKGIQPDLENIMPGWVIVEEERLMSLGLINPKSITMDSILDFLLNILESKKKNEKE